MDTYNGNESTLKELSQGIVKCETFDKRGSYNIIFDKKASRINSLFGNFGQSESEEALLILLKILFLKKDFT